MKKHLFLLSALLLQVAAVSVSAQDNEYVDLGLSVKWATCNVGAATHLEVGKHYDWNYELQQGEDWLTPSNDEMIELLSYCTWTWVENVDSCGFKVTSDIEGFTDRSIFFPVIKERIPIHEIVRINDVKYTFKVVDSIYNYRGNYMTNFINDQNRPGYLDCGGHYPMPTMHKNGYPGLDNFHIRPVKPLDSQTKQNRVLPIDRKNFEIRLEDDKDLPSSSWEDYETLDSREFRDIAERSKNKGLLDMSVNTSDPGFYKNIRISDNTIVSESAPVKDGPKAGDTISGVVFDDNGPMMLVNVVERDSNYRIVAHCITDIEGKFSFRLVNPDHRIQVSFVGYKTVDAPIDTTFLNIRMEDAGDLPPVEIISDRVQETGPMPLPIPLREAAKDVDTIDMSQFEDLGLYTIDEVLNAKIR